MTQLYECKVCRATFIREPDLVSHYSNVHPDFDRGHLVHIKSMWRSRVPMGSVATINHMYFEFFQSKLFELLKDHKGQFVIVKDCSFHGFYSSSEDALKAAYEKFGNADFLIQEITDELR